MKCFMFAALLAVSSAAIVEVHGPATIPRGWTPSDEKVKPGAVFKNVMIGLKRSNMEKLRQISEEVSNPMGPKYLQYPTYEEMGDLVRPAAAHTAAVKSWLAENGVSDVTEYPHGDYLKVEATAAQLEKMANGEFVTYTHSSGMKIHRITSGVRVPGEVAEAVDTFSGFNGFPLNPVAAPVKGEAPTCQGCVVTPPFLRKTYNISHVAKSGKTNIQAIAQFQGQYVSNEDLSNFCKEYDPASGSCKIEKYVGPDQPSQPGIESMLDTEYITTIGETDTTWVYSYPNFDFCSDLTTFGSAVLAESTHPYTISISYGSQFIDFCSKSLIQRFSEDIQKISALGATVLISSGDDGSGGETRQGPNNGKLSPSYPASIPHAVAVGSTYFVDGDKPGPEEATTQFGSGGGFSYDFPVQSYQADAIKTYLANVNKPTGVGYATNGRGSPDVSALGEKFTVLFGGQSLAVGGTSASSPTFAGIVTLLNEICLAESGKSLGFANPLFYQNAGAFRDVTVGTNAIGENTKGWEAIKGWDAATGLGTPNFPALASVVKKACASAKRNF